MFAGPNGSGKTTIKLGLHRPAEWFGVYINPDELEQQARETGRISLADLGLNASTEELQGFFRASSLLALHHLSSVADAVRCDGVTIDLSAIEMNSYVASALADFLRRKTLASNKSFSFETVMSSPDKVELLRDAQSRGFRTYLYFVATEDPSINVARVRLRVSQGGHDVPEDKIIARYQRSLALAVQAIKFSHRAFFFDTSGQHPLYFAEVRNATVVELKGGSMPAWFKPIWEQI
jgi:predicted ABC-type ATPase